MGIAHINGERQPSAEMTREQLERLCKATEGAVVATEGATKDMLIKNCVTTVNLLAQVLVSFADSSDMTEKQRRRLAETLIDAAVFIREGR